MEMCLEETVFGGHIGTRWQRASFPIHASQGLRWKELYLAKSGTVSPEWEKTMVQEAKEGMIVYSLDWRPVIFLPSDVQ